MSRSYILIPHLGISLVSWFQIILSMNRYKGILHFLRTDLWSLLIFLHGGLVRWVSAVSLTMEDTVHFQLLSAIVGTTLSWISFVLIFNRDVIIPSYQQFWALFMSLVITLLWEFSNYLAVQDY